MREMNELDLAKEYCIFKCRAGSHAYGTNSAHSDIDTRGIFIAPPSYLGPFRNVEQVEVPGEDTVIYELSKFMRLAADCNPNIIELLFTEEENSLFEDQAYTRLKAHRHLFLSKKAKYTFSGYAMAQMKRIRGHHKWINNPQPEQPPNLLDFATLIGPDGVVSKLSDELLEGTFLAKVNATTFRLLSSSVFGKPILSEDKMNVQFVDVDPERLKDNAVWGQLKFLGTLIIQIETFRIQHRMWKDYWSWKRNRNQARAKLEEHHGFDTKHAMHLMRLLRMAHEILGEGKVIVKRPDADELLAIRNGSFNYEQLILEAERMEGELDALYETSTLPHSSDKEAINSLFFSICRDFWRRHDLI